MVTPYITQAECMIAKLSSTHTRFCFHCTNSRYLLKGATLSLWLFYFKFNETNFANFTPFEAPIHANNIQLDTWQQKRV